MHILVTIYDIKADVYSPPMLFRNKAEATRALIAEANNKESLIGKHPTDFIAYIVGNFDTESGSLLGTDAERIGIMSEYVNN